MLEACENCHEKRKKSDSETFKNNQMSRIETYKRLYQYISTWMEMKEEEKKGLNGKSNMRIEGKITKGYPMIGFLSPEGNFHSCENETEKHFELAVKIVKDKFNSFYIQIPKIKHSDNIFWNKVMIQIQCKNHILQKGYIQLIDNEVIYSVVSNNQLKYLFIHRDNLNEGQRETLDIYLRLHPGVAL